MASNDKRNTKRIRLFSPISATIDGARVTVIDVSQVGARIEHHFPLSTGAAVRADFEYEGTLIPVDCEVIRCKLDRSVVKDAISYTSGLRFLEPDAEPVATLMKIVSGVVSEDIEARRSYAKKPAKKR